MRREELFALVEPAGQLRTVVTVGVHDEPSAETLDLVHHERRRIRNCPQPSCNRTGVQFEQIAVLHDLADRLKRCVRIFRMILRSKAVLGNEVEMSDDVRLLTNDMFGQQVEIPLREVEIIPAEEGFDRIPVQSLTGIERIEFPVIDQLMHGRKNVVVFPAGQARFRVLLDTAVNTDLILVLFGKRADLAAVLLLSLDGHRIILTLMGVAVI